MSTRRGRPPTFTRDELVATALQLGPEGIGLQQVATALGVSRTSLYWHVRDQDELGELVLAELVQAAADPDWAPEPDAAWSTWLDAYARSLRRSLLAGGPWLRYGVGGVFHTEATLRIAEQVLSVLLDAGFELREATGAFVFVSQLVYANVRAAAGVDTPKRNGRDALLRELRSLERDDVPVLRAAVDAVRTSHDMQFEYELAAALAGVAAHARLGQR